MKLKNLLKLCSRNKFAATLFGILVISIISSMVFVQSVYGQNALHQIFETSQISGVFSETPDAEDATGVSADNSDLVTKKQEIIPEISRPVTPSPVSPSPAQETAAVTAAEVTAAQVTPTARPTAKPAKAPTAKQTAIQTTQAVTAAEPAETAPPGSGSFNGGMASAVLDLANQQRTGLCALAWNDSLSSTAQTRAKEIAVSFSHTRPDGSAWYTAGSSMAENIAKGQSSSVDVMALWMASAPHAANITNGSYTQMGAACYCVDGTYYWVQEFS
ncbi:MAG: CAP domain-containing protein [Eubacteriales bacterium]